MIKTITNDDLVRYIYGETNAEESDQIEQVSEWDRDVKQDLSEFKSILKELDKIELAPSEKFVDNLMFFSRKYKA